MPRSLTVKQLRFIEAYLGRANGNATEAYKRAGYRCTDGSARVESSRLLANPNVAAEVEYRLRQTALKPDQILARISEMATIDMADFVDIDEGGGLSRLNLTRAAGSGKTRLIKGLDVGTDGVVKLKLHDSLKALTVLAKVHGLLTDPGAKPADADPADPDAAERALKAANELPARPDPDAPLGAD